MEALKPGSFGHRVCLGKKVVGKTANRVSAKCAIPVWSVGSLKPALSPRPSRWGQLCFP
jgi:hypothetical protein